MVPAVMLRSVISPDAKFVFPAPEAIVRLTAPVPALIDVPEAMVSTAEPGSRCALTTPFANSSLATIVKLPLSVVMLALISTLRPACSVKAPPLPPGLLTVMDELTVISLLACSVTAVPVFNVVVRNVGEIVSDDVD